MKPSQHHEEIGRTDLNDATWLPTASLQHELHTVLCIMQAYYYTGLQLSCMTKNVRKCFEHDN